MIIQARKLSQAIKRVSRLIAKSTSLEITKSIRLIQRNNELRIEVCNFTAYGVVIIPNEGEDEEYRFLLESLTPLLRDIPQNEEIEITLKKDIIRVKYGSGYAQMKAINPDISLITVPDNRPCCRINAGVLAGMVERAEPFVSRDMSEIAKGGICFDIIDGYLNCVSTDGARLSIQRVQVEAEPNRVIATSQYIGAISSIFDADEEIDITITPSFIVFSSTRGILGTSLIRSEYPNYSKVLGSVKPYTEVRINVANLISIIRRAYYFVTTETLKAVVDITGNTLTLAATNYLYHKSSEERISMVKKGLDIQIGVKVSYLLAALSLIRGDDVVFRLDSPDRAILITESATNDFESLYIIMPMKLGND